MPKGLQKHKIKRELSRLGVSPDLADVAAMIDSSLHYGENLSNIKRRLGLDRKKLLETGRGSRRIQRRAINQFKDQAIDFAKQQARARNNARSQHAQRVDEMIRADRVITDKILRGDPDAIDAWFKHPNRLDIHGIDD